MLIGLSQQTDKLVFEIVRLKNAVIANQSADWCGNPPVERNQVTITTKIARFSRSVGQLSIHFPSNRGIATTSVRTGLAMTALFFKHQFVGLLRKTDGRFIVYIPKGFLRKL